ncbi:MobQ family relaxase [Bacillus toyonensis]|uniref:MobQ family relaxase n=1 Tax=Bacillus toyonensis TaxID=155322 RepID=UPI000BFD08B1|nr:MobQ family relaxase [Bacillus toyonensis]PHG64058.1 hypothetical protein COI59_17130 [Bacillus toyonensis]
MAVYHYNTQVIKRSEGRNVVAAAAYRSGDRLVDETTGEIKFYHRGVEPVAFVLAPENAPEWVYDRQVLWNEVEKSEKRSDSQLAREINVALPKELSYEQQEELVKEFVQDNFVNHGMVADVAIHRDDENNPHFHVMLTMRYIDENGFGKKAREWNPGFKNVKGGRGFIAEKDTITQARSMWAKHANDALAKAGIEERITHLRLDTHLGKDKDALLLVPTQHLGPKQNAMEKKGIRTPKGDLNREIKNHNAEVKSFHEEKQRIKETRKQEKEFDTLSVAEKVALKDASRVIKKYATYESCSGRLEQLKNWETRIQNKIELEPTNNELYQQLYKVTEQKNVVEKAVDILEQEALRELPNHFSTESLSQFTKDELCTLYQHMKEHGKVTEEGLSNWIEEYRESQQMDIAKRYMKDTPITIDTLQKELNKLTRWESTLQERKQDLFEQMNKSQNPETFKAMHKDEFDTITNRESWYKEKRNAIENGFDILERELRRTVFASYPNWNRVPYLSVHELKDVQELNRYHGRMLSIDELENREQLTRFTKEERKEIYDVLDELKEIKKAIPMFKKDGSEESLNKIQLLQNYMVTQKENIYAKYGFSIEDKSFLKLFREECKQQKDMFWKKEAPEKVQRDKPQRGTLTNEERESIKLASKELKRFVSYDACEKRLDQLDKWEKSLVKQISNDPTNNELYDKLYKLHQQREIIQDAKVALENEATRELNKRFNSDFLSPFAKDELRYVFDHIKQNGEITKQTLAYLVEGYQGDKAIDNAKRYVKEPSYEKLKVEMDKLTNWKRAIERKLDELAKGLEKAPDQMAFQKENKDKFEEVFSQEQSYEQKKAVLEKAFEVVGEREILKLALQYPEWQDIEHFTPEQAHQILETNRYYGRVIGVSEFATLKDSPKFNYNQREEIYDAISNIKEIQKAISVFEKQNTEEAEKDIATLEKYYATYQAVLDKHGIDMNNPTMMRLFREECENCGDVFVEKDSAWKTKFTPEYAPSERSSASGLIGEILYAIEQAERDADRKTQERQRQAQGIRMKRQRQRGMNLDL